jgi:hypothetical protein
MAKIFWTQDEVDLVLAHAQRHFANGNCTPFEAISYAQAALPVSRQRPFNTYSAAYTLIKEFKLRMARDVPKQKAIEPPTPANEVAPMPISAPMVPTLDDLVHAIAKKIDSTVKQEIAIAVKELEHEFGVHKHNGEYAATGIKKKRVVVIGLLNDQVYAIQRDFGNNFEVKCIDTDRAMGMSPPDADAYLLMKNFINHPLYHKYQVFPNHVLIDGGMSSLRMWFYTKGIVL